MKTGTSLVTAILLLIMGLVAAAPAEVVGRLTQVEGRVDLLKGGKLPATAAKLEDAVEPGDVLRTKSLSKAQVTFVDNTVITISPESRIAIEEYMFDPAKGKRSGVLQLFHGMALAVVTKLFKVEQPDFVIKTHTAIMGVRGTEVGVRLSPNESTFLNFQGLTRVANIFPEVSGDLFRKAAKVAFSFDKGFVDLRDMQATRVSRGLPPTLPYAISEQDRQMFMRQMAVQALSQGSGGATAGVTPSGLSAPVSTATAETGAVAGSPLPTGVGTPPPPVIITPTPVVTPPTPPTPTVTLVNLFFAQTWTGPGTLVATTQPSGTFSSTGPGSGTFTITSFAPGSATISLFPNGFTMSNLSFLATLTTPGTLWNNGWQGTFNSSATGNLGGQVSGTLTGNMNMILSIPGNQTFSLSGPVTYTSGNLTFNFNFTPPPSDQPVTANFFRTNGGDPRGIVSNGIWSQTATSGIATAVAPIVTPVQAQAGAPMGTGMRARR